MTIWAQNLTEALRRRYVKNWYLDKTTPFAHIKKAYENEGEEIQKKLKTLKEKCDVIRLICHTQVGLLSLKQKKAHVMEIQVNY